MREWSLGPGSPLLLRLAADFRSSDPDYTNDHIWELETSGGDPPALSLHTTYGLRARSMRIFPRFIFGRRAVSDPAAFPQPPCLKRFQSNFLSIRFSPLPGLELTSETWVPDSHTLLGSFTALNRQAGPLSFQFELCGQLVPLIGASLTMQAMQSTNVLTGRCADLAPVIFLTGGPHAGMGPYPALALDITLAPGESRTVSWAQAALAEVRDSFELSRKLLARRQEPDLARIEFLNEAQAFEIFTGDPDWDAAFSFSQAAAFRLFFGSGPHLSYPSFVFSREVDQGYSPRGDGTDYPYLWSGQSPLEAYYISGLLPGAPQLAAGLVRNFLATPSADGGADWKPGLAGQRGRWLAVPLLASLAWRTYQVTGDLEFLRETLPKLEDYYRCWFDRAHDCDGDGFPEWDHPLQAGIEDAPPFTTWQAGGQGANISFAESPALAAMLHHEAGALANITAALGLLPASEAAESRCECLRALVEECWDEDAALYHLRDRDTHCCPGGKLLGSRRGPGRLELARSLRQPLRLLLRLELKSEATRRVEIDLQGKNGEMVQSETFGRADFQWGSGLAVTTSRLVYTGVTGVLARGLDKTDRLSVSIMDFTAEDLSLFLPLWAGIPDLDRARTLVQRSLMEPGRFGQPYGIPLCAASDSGESSSSCAVLMPWNTLIGEGLLGYGLQQEAAELTTRLMAAVVRNLKQQHAFARAYHAGTGAGLGPRNSVQGLAPLGLFLETLGVQVLSPERVVLGGKNPFPWPVTVKYRGLTVTRQAEQTLVTFPDGRSVTLDDPTDALVSSG